MVVESFPLPPFDSIVVNNHKASILRFVTRLAKIKLMTLRGKEWRKIHPKKTPNIRIQNLHMAHHGMVRLPIGFAAEVGEVFCNQDGWEFLKALDPQNEIQPTVSMVLAVLDRMNK